MLVLFTAVIGFFAIAAVRADDAAKKEMEKLAGIWIVVQEEKDGTEVPTTKGVDAPTLNLKKDGKYQYQSGDQKHQGTWKCDTTQKPSQIDLTPDDGKTKPMQGIYQQQDDNQLQVCLSAPGKDRPSKFTTKQGTGQQSITCKKK
jgi:uncharacterized protein (TIGR03067 family)